MTLSDWFVISQLKENIMPTVFYPFMDKIIENQKYKETANTSIQPTKRQEAKSRTESEPEAKKTLLAWKYDFSNQSGSR